MHLDRIRLPLCCFAPVIYLSDIEAASDETTLRKHHIDLVISILGSENNIPEFPNIRYVRFTIHDGEGNIVDIAKQVATLLDSARHQQVLIHCHAGRSRSASVVIYYAMTRCLRLTYEKAKTLVADSRPVISPAPLYEEQLREVEN